MNLPLEGLKGISLAEERGFMDLAPYMIRLSLYPQHILVPLLAGMRGAACDKGPQAMYPNLKN